MGTFLLILFIIFFVIPAIRAWWTIRRARAQARQAYEDIFRKARRQQQQAEERQRRQQKKYAPTDGEYVQFEEIQVETSTQTTIDADPSATSGRRTTVETDQQIVDVEWEEVD